MDDRQKGLNYCFLGDSITEGVGVNIGERYFDILSENLGFNAFGFGFNGATAQDVLSEIDKMEQKLGKNVDLVSVFIGTNDFYSNVPLGEFFTQTEETVCVVKDDFGNPIKTEMRKKRNFNFDENTFCGRLNNIFSKLRKDYPFADFIIMTPLHRAYATFGNDNIQYDELYSNGIGLFIEDYVNAVRRCADVWAIKLVDLYKESGLFPLNDDCAKEYFTNVNTDRLHPNKNGHLRLAKAIEKYL